MWNSSGKRLEISSVTGHNPALLRVIATIFQVYLPDVGTEWVGFDGTGDLIGSWGTPTLKIKYVKRVALEVDAQETGVGAGMHHIDKHAELLIWHRVDDVHHSSLDLLYWSGLARSIEHLGEDRGRPTAG